MERPAHAPPKFRYILAACAGAALAFYLVFVRRYEYLNSLQAFFGVVIVSLGLLPGIISLADRREAGLIPLMPLHGLFYVATFGLPAFSAKTLWMSSGEDAITAPLVLTAMGLVCLCVGYYAFRGFYARMNSIRARDIPLDKQVRAAWLMFCAYWVIAFVPGLKSLPSFDQLSMLLLYLSLGVLAVLFFGGKLPRRHQVFFVSAASIIVLLFALSGSLAAPVMFLVFFGILYWNQRRRMPWHFIVLVGLITVILNPVKSRFRDYTWYSNETSISYYDKAILMYTVVKEHYSDADLLSKVGDDTTTVNRLAYISTFGYVISMTPSAIPYWGGDSYHTLWTSFIPRMIWPGKPKATIGQDFGHRYALIRPDDEVTSYNLPWLVEFYANFGTFGVAVGMFLVGVLFRFLTQKFRAPVSSPLEHVIGVTIMFGLFDAESNFALMAGGILSTFIAFLVLRRLLTRGAAPAASPHAPLPGGAGVK